MKRKILSMILWLGLPVLAFAGLESATYINQLVVSNPTGTDHYSTADDHLRLLKSVLVNSFPQISGPVTATQTELNKLDGVTATTTELNLLAGRTGTIWTSTNDGAASTLDADLLDGNSSAFFQDAANLNAGTLANARVSAGNVTQHQAALTIVETQITDGALLARVGGTETISGVWTYSARPAFNGGTSGSSSPFTVDSTQVVTSLNADLLDGSNAADFAAASHNHDAGDITTGTLAIARGGTGTTTGVARNISGKTGTAKTLSSSAPSGGADGDIWYRF